MTICAAKGLWRANVPALEPPGARPHLPAVPPPHRMPRSAVWLLSLLAFAALCVLCVSQHARAIEADLEARTAAALGASELRGAAEVAFSGRTATVRADDPEIAALVAERVRGIDGVRGAVIGGPLAPLPPVEIDGPFALMPLASGGLALRGAVPDSATRERLLGAAQMAFPERRIRDGLVLDGAASGEWAGDVAATFSRLKAVQNPGLSVDSAGALVLSGTVGGEGARRNVQTRVAEVVAPRAVESRLAIAGEAAPPEASGETARAEPQRPSSGTAPPTPEAADDAPDSPAPEAATPDAAAAGQSAADQAAAGQVEVQNALPRDADAQGAWSARSARGSAAGRSPSRPARTGSRRAPPPSSAAPRARSGRSRESPSSSRPTPTPRGRRPPTSDSARRAHAPPSASSPTRA